MGKATPAQIIATLRIEKEFEQKRFLKEADKVYNMRGLVEIIIKKMEDPKIFFLDFEIIKELKEAINWRNPIYAETTT